MSNSSINIHSAVKEVAVKEVMQRNVVSVSADSTLTVVRELFISEKISGAPVIDSDGTVCGVISVMDIVAIGLRETDSNYPPGGYYRYVPEWATLMPDSSLSELDLLKAVDVKTDEVIAVSEDSSIVEAAALMRSRHVHRLLVLSGESLSGIVTSLDLLRVFEDGGGAFEASSK